MLRKVKKKKDLQITTLAFERGVELDDFRMSPEVLILLGVYI